jgi:hypothetical protein
MLVTMAGNSLLNGETRVYEEKIKGRITTHNFIIDKSITGCTITLRSETGGKQIDQKFELATNLSALSWFYGDPEKKTKITAAKKGNKIYLKGIHEGKQIDKTFKINALPWNQSFNIGLEKFAVSTEKKMKFWAIGTSGPGDMKITTFSVKKKEVETITLKGKEVAAVHLQISLTGLLSIFWTGNYWYRKADGKFLRYKGKDRGSSRDGMELISEKTSD